MLSMVSYFRSVNVNYGTFMLYSYIHGQSLCTPLSLIEVPLIVLLQLYSIQWNLRIKDTLGTIILYMNSAVVSFVERLSSSRRYYMWKKTFWDLGLCPFRVPISEVPLYVQGSKIKFNIIDVVESDEI